jgi:hypothetical protein
VTALTLEGCQLSAETALREAHRDALGIGTVLRPPDAGQVQFVRDAVAAAFKLGQQSAALEVAEAYQLFLDNEDLDVLRDTLTGLLPEGYTVSTE